MEITKEQPPAVYTLKLNREEVYALYQDLAGLRTFDAANTPLTHAPLAHELFNALRDTLREEDA